MNFRTWINLRLAPATVKRDCTSNKQEEFVSKNGKSNVDSDCKGVT
jgi:hypothetical protein